MRGGIIDRRPGMRYIERTGVYGAALCSALGRTDSPRFTVSLRGDRVLVFIDTITPHLMDEARNVSVRLEENHVLFLLRLESHQVAALSPVFCLADGRYAYPTFRSRFALPQDVIVARRLVRAPSRWSKHMYERCDVNPSPGMTLCKLSRQPLVYVTGIVVSSKKARDFTCETVRSSTLFRNNNKQSAR